MNHARIAGPVKYLSLAFLLTVFVIGSARQAHAARITLVAVLSGLNEIPANASPGTGSATIVLDTVAQTLQLDVTFAGLTSNAVAAHIHCCLPSPFALVNVGVATTVPAFLGFPLGGTSGTYTSPEFDLTLSGIYNPAFITAQGSLANAEAALISALESDETYLNIHTVNFGGGEIRGFVVTPEPASLMLLGSGLLGLCRMRRRQRPATSV